MKLRLLNGVFLCALVLVGCSDEGTGHTDDPTPGGTPNTIEDTSPEALNKMEKIGDPNPDQ